MLEGFAKLSWREIVGKGIGSAPERRMDRSNALITAAGREHSPNNVGVETS